MGNPDKRTTVGPCPTCNANNGPWYGEPGSVHCLRPGDSGRHVLRGDQATAWTHICWKPRDVPVLSPLEEAKRRLAGRP
jgi:hypothetical protein